MNGRSGASSGVNGSVHAGAKPAECPIAPLNTTNLPFTAGRKGVMRSVEEQQALVTAAAVAPRPVRVAISEAQGLLCAEEVVTERPLPGFDQAAIDGYAVRSVDVLGVGPQDGSDSDDDSDSADDGNQEISLPVMGSIE